ncbi:hypothetical protein TNCV_3109231 [Trichonephila clavipes]|nr:hypothetical protein TNCV_3109231 [Trichonephila clavipes]
MLLTYVTEHCGLCPPDLSHYNGDLDSDLRKPQPSRNCRGAIYPLQEQSKVVSSTRHGNQSRQTYLTQKPKPSDPLDATTHMHTITNISFVRLSTDSLIEYCSGITYISQ